MAEAVKKLTRKEKIAAGLEKKPNRKKAYAEGLKLKRQENIGATLRNYPTSPRKMRYIIDQIRGKAVSDALNILKFTTRAGANDVAKLVLSAVNNVVTQNDKTGVDDLFIREMFVDQSRTLKRFRPAPQGRAYRIRKRSNHISIILGTKTNNA